MRTLPDSSVDSVCCDPPYGLGFMGKDWDNAAALHRPPSAAAGDTPLARFRTGKGPAAVTFDGIAFQAWCQQWAAECLRVLKPGGHLLAFGGTRTWHRLACAVEDAGFEIRDSLAWMHGQGFPKSQNVSKALAGKGICRCDVGQLEDGDDDLRGVREGVSDLPPDAASSEVTDLLATVQRPSSRSAVGAVRGSGSENARPLRPALRGGQPSLEGRGDAQAAEGQLHGGQVRPLSSGVPGDGSSGRLHHGASSGDGSVGGPLSAAVGSGEPQGPQPSEQRTVKSGAVPVERRPQTWGGWPVCGRCSQPVVPDGLGTAMKPAFEPVVVARKPLVGTVANNVLAHGTGALNVDACRIEGPPSGLKPYTRSTTPEVYALGMAKEGRDVTFTDHPAGRWPANVVLDQSQADALDQQSGTLTSGALRPYTAAAGERVYGHSLDGRERDKDYTSAANTGGASRFFKVVSSTLETCPLHGDASTTAANTSAGKRAANITDSSPTAGSGNRQTDPSQADTTSTTETTTHSTTTSPTSHSSAPKSTETTTDETARTTRSSAASSTDTANDVNTSCHCPSSQSGEPEPSRATAANANATTSANGERLTESTTTPICVPIDRLDARFRYVAKAPKKERPNVDGTSHPTVKPLTLMRWLVRLVTPPGGTVLEPFAGSGTTVEACVLEGFHCIAIEREADYLPLIEARLARHREPAPAPIASDAEILAGIDKAVADGNMTVFDPAAYGLDDGQLDMFDLFDGGAA
jgi:DNA modification methylase